MIRIAFCIFIPPLKSRDRESEDKTSPSDSATFPNFEDFDPPTFGHPQTLFNVMAPF